MSTIWVALGPMVPLLQSMVTQLLRTAEDIEISTAPHAMTGHEPRLGAEPHVLIVGSAATDREIEGALRGSPALTVIRFEDGGHDFSVHQMRPTRRLLQDQGMARLLETIRSAARAGVPR